MSRSTAYRVAMAASVLFVLSVCALNFGLVTRAAPPAQVSCAGSVSAADGVCLELRAISACGAASAETGPDTSATFGGPHRHGYCRCSCGYPCQTSADCGGASCDPFITCC